MAKKEVLIVDDDETVLEVLDKTLSKHGFSVTQHTSALAALDLLKKKNYPLLISDICMPELGGLDLINEARKLRPRIKTIAVTGYGTDDRLMKCIDMDCFGYVDKPYDIEYMLALVSSAFN